jgi:hypothetical protein
MKRVSAGLKERHYDNIPGPRACSEIQVGKFDPPFPRQTLSSIQCYQPVLITEMQKSQKLWLSNNYG